MFSIFNKNFPQKNVIPPPLLIPPFRYTERNIQYYTSSNTSSISTEFNDFNPSTSVDSNPSLDIREFIDQETLDELLGVSDALNESRVSIKSTSNNNERIIISEVATTYPENLLPQLLVESPLQIRTQVKSLIPPNRLGLSPTIISSPSPSNLSLSLSLPSNSSENEELNQEAIRREITQLGEEWTKSEQSWERLERAEILKLVLENKVGLIGGECFLDEKSESLSGLGIIGEEEEEIGFGEEDVLGVVLVEEIRSRKRRNVEKYEERIKELRAQLSYILG